MSVIIKSLTIQCAGDATQHGTSNTRDPVSDVCIMSRRGIHSADADGERLATKRVKPPRVVNTSRASEIPCKWVVRDTTPDMQQSLAKRPRVSKANHGTKATETSGRGPASPIKRSDSRIEASQASPREPHPQSVQSLHNVRPFHLCDLVS
ncbi:hypothetical protein EDC04DRAFT_983230 [Pisolithus marmoratus]|nr:hypothetical protein EDC04DRAFT_983230 [Pisolithus marmoratus]